jgi:uncharacterized protein
MIKIILKRLALFTALLLLLIAFLLVNFIARIKAEQLIHPGKTPAAVTPAQYGLSSFQDVRFSTPDGLQLAAWYIPGDEPATVILVHGFASNRGNLLPEAAILHQAGLGVLLIDSRTCGDSQGSLNSFGLYEANDIRAALDFLARQPGIDPTRTGLLGHSQGASTVLHAAAQMPQVRAVIAESAFTSMEDNLNSAMRNLVRLPPFPFTPLVIFWGQQLSGLDMGMVRPIDWVGRTSPRPLLLIHGGLDNILPVENAARLYAAAGQPKELYLLPQAGHDNLRSVGGEEYARRLAGFFRAALLAPKN